MKEIDITELLEACVKLLEKAEISRESTESKIILNAKEEIERLRKSKEFYIEESEHNNKSRLYYMDRLLDAQDFYEKTCKSVRERSVGDYVCGMCRWDCDTSIGPSGDYMQECPGFERDDCFELDIKKYKEIIFKKGGAE